MQPEAHRDSVDYRHDAIHPEFLEYMARIAAYSDDKYGDTLNYMDSRLAGEKGPINHAHSHLGQYQLGRPYDHFDGDLRWHLAAVAYNAMMEFVYVTRGEEPDIWGRRLPPSKNGK